MCIGLKPEMHMKDDIRLLIPVASETQVDLQNRPEDQVLARQNTSGHKSGVLSPQDSGWVRPTNLRIKISSETILHLTFLHWIANAVAPETLVGWQHQIRGSMCPFNICK